MSDTNDRIREDLKIPYLRAFAGILKPLEGTDAHKTISDTLNAQYDDGVSLLDIRDTGRATPGLEEDLAKQAAPFYEKASRTAKTGIASLRRHREKLQKTIDAGFSGETRFPDQIRDRLAAMRSPEPAAPPAAKLDITGKPMAASPADFALAQARADVEHRLQFIGRRTRSGDRDVLLAVLDAPLWISGLDHPEVDVEKELAAIRTEAEAKLFPQEVAQRAMIDDFTGRIERAHQEIDSIYGAIVESLQMARTREEQRTAKARNKLDAIAGRLGATEPR
jgi:hypothetical protein